MNKGPLPLFHLLSLVFLSGLLHWATSGVFEIDQFLPELKLTYQEKEQLKVSFQLVTGE